MSSRFFFTPHQSTCRFFGAGIFAGFSVAAISTASNKYYNYYNNVNHQNNNNNHDNYLPFFSMFGNNATSSVNASLAQCAGKAPDTPEYLIPYYLRDTKSRFVHYASLRDGGSRKMKPADFLAAMLALPDEIIEEKVDKQSMEKFRKFFKWADADGDGTINYGEFAFLANILAYPLRDYKVLFRMFDQKDKGALSPDEFVKMLVSVSDENMKPKLRSGIIRAMFIPDEHTKFCSGDDNKPTVRAAKKQDPNSNSVRMIADKVPDSSVVTFDRFSSVVRKIESMIAETEFNLYDKGNKGHVTNEEFGSMITSSIHGRHLPFFIVDNLRKLAKDTNNEIKLDTYTLFTEIIGRAEDVATALQLYSSAGFAIRATDLKRALDRVVKLSRPIELREAQLITSMFDANSDGDLHIDEFVSILRAKASYCGVLPREKERDNVFSRLATCTSEAISGNKGDSGNDE